MSEATETALVIDPVAMNIVNRIAAGTKITTPVMECGGGLIIDGALAGNVWVSDGPLVLWSGGRFKGSLYVQGDAYLFGVIEPNGADKTQLVVTGTVYLAHTLRAKGDIAAGAFRTFQGATTEGLIRSGAQVLPPVPRGAW